MEEKTYVFDSASGSNLASILAPLLSNRGIDASTLALLNNQNGFGGNGGWFIWILFLLIFSGGWGNGFGGFGNGSAGFLSNQISNDTGRDLLMQAIQGNRDSLSALATNLNTNVSAIQNAICGLNSSIQSVGSQVGMSGMQVQNAIQAGNQALASQLAQCCCDNKLLTTQQGYESRIQILEQTNSLNSHADLNTNAITGAIADLRTEMATQFCSVKERELQSKIDTLVANNAALKGQIDNANQTAQIAAMLQPLQSEVSAIKASQPHTVPVTWPNITAVNTTPTLATTCGYSYGCGGYGYPYSGSLWA